MTDDVTRDRLDALLAPLNVPYELFACDPALADTAAFCAHYGFKLGDSANTIVVVGKSEPRQFAACVVLATTRANVSGKVLYSATAVALCLDDGTGTRRSPSRQKASDPSYRTGAMRPSCARFLGQRVTAESPWREKPTPSGPSPAELS